MALDRERLPRLLNEAVLRKVQVLQMRKDTWLRQLRPMARALFYSQSLMEPELLLSSCQKAVGCSKRPERSFTCCERFRWLGSSTSLRGAKLKGLAPKFTEICQLASTPMQGQKRGSELARSKKETPKKRPFKVKKMPKDSFNLATPHPTTSPWPNLGILRGAFFTTSSVRSTTSSSSWRHSVNLRGLQIKRTQGSSIYHTFTRASKIS